MQELTTGASKPGINSKKSHNRFAKLASFGLSDLLFSSGIFGWFFAELVIVFAAYVVGVACSPHGEFGVWSAEHLIFAGCYSALFVLCALGLDLYDHSKVSNIEHSFRACLVSSILSFFVTIGLFYFFFYKSVHGRQTLLYGFAFAVLAVAFERFWIIWLSRYNPRRFAVVGSSPVTEEISKFSEGHKSVVQYQWQTKDPELKVPDREDLLRHNVSELIVSRKNLEDTGTLDFAVLALQSKIKVVGEVDFYKQIFRRLPVDGITRSWILQEGIAKRKVVTIFGKRLMDIILSLVAIILASPLFIALMIAIKVTSRGPIFFFQERRGRYFEPFTMYKFRTMYVDKSPSGKFTSKNDPRVTPIGKFLRPLHLDELPQLLNILLGKMSIVGPRPETVEFSEKMRKDLSLYELRYLVRPGLTGYAQLHHGYAMDNLDSTKNKLSYDLYYLCYYTFWFDIVLMIRTVFFLTKGSR